MISVYSAQDLHDAELLKHRLDQAGIESVVRNGFLQGALGELPLSVLPEVCVLRQEDVERARACVVEMEDARRAPEEEEVTCSACGSKNPSNFELCYACRADLAV